MPRCKVIQSSEMLCHFKIFFRCFLFLGGQRWPIKYAWMKNLKAPPSQAGTHMCTAVVWKVTPGTVPAWREGPEQAQRWWLSDHTYFPHRKKKILSDYLVVTNQNDHLGSDACDCFILKKKKTQKKQQTRTELKLLICKLVQSKMHIPNKYAT